MEAILDRSSLRDMATVDVKNDYGYTDVAVADHYTSNVYCAVIDDDDDDIICLDGDDYPVMDSTPAKEAEAPTSTPTISTGESRMSRLLLQIIRLHLSEDCVNPACAAVRAETSKLQKKLTFLEDFSIKLRQVYHSQSEEIAKLNEESAKQRRKISQMEGVIERQGAALREFQNKFNNLQGGGMGRPLSVKQPYQSVQRIINGSSASAGRPVNNKTSMELPGLTQRTPNFLSNGVTPLYTPNVRKYVRKTPLSSYGPSQPPKLSPQRPPMSPAAAASPIVDSPKCSRLKLSMPFVPESAMIEYFAPVTNPLMDYPMECYRCRLASSSELTLEIKTEPSNFLLTKKVQGVIKCNYVTEPGRLLQQKIKIFCYLESALKVQSWRPSAEHEFISSDKIKFDIVFAKDQHISRFDRVVAFAFASVGGIKFITNRIIFNVGDQAGPPQPDSLREDPMDTEPELAPPAKKREVLDDSNFEVYRPS